MVAESWPRLATNILCLLPFSCHCTQS